MGMSMAIWTKRHGILHRIITTLCQWLDMMDLKIGLLVCIFDERGRSVAIFTNTPGSFEYFHHHIRITIELNLGR